MIGELFRALLMAAVPVGAFTYLLIWWGLRSGYFQHTTKLKLLEDEVSRQAKARSKKKKKDKTGEPVQHEPGPKFDPVHNKWLAFGGGFYGTVALMTFGVIEAGEIFGFFADLRANLGRLAELSIGLLVEVFIDQLKNFVSALAWPWYWMNEIRTGDIWLWFLAAYAGYWLGARAALIRKGPAEPAK